MLFFAYIFSDLFKLSSRLKVTRVTFKLPHITIPKQSTNVDWMGLVMNQVSSFCYLPVNVAELTLEYSWQCILQI